MTRPTKEQIETLAAWVHWKKKESGLSESDQDFVQAVSAILEEIDALNANQCTGCCYQAESVDCDLRELAKLRTEAATLSAENRRLTVEVAALHGLIPRRVNKQTGQIYADTQKEADLVVERDSLREELATLRHEFKMLLPGALRYREALRKLREEFYVCRPDFSSELRALYNSAIADADQVLGKK